MLVQHRDSRLRLITQHDHALLAGEAASAWDPPLPVSVVLAVALHDAGWRRLDGTPRWDPVAGSVLSFDRMPREEKFAAASDWLDRLETIDPYAALLVSGHYSTFGSGEKGSFHAAEAVRRERLRAGGGLPGSESTGEHLDVLRFLDNLSLLLCLAPPGAGPEGSPDWLDEELLRLPGGTPVGIEWSGEEAIRLDPSPLRGEIVVRVRYREIPRPDGAAELARAWAGAETGLRELRLRGG